jgi:hypothetical protein
VSGGRVDVLPGYEAVAKVHSVGAYLLHFEPPQPQPINGNAWAPRRVTVPGRRRATVALTDHGLKVVGVLLIEPRGAGELDSPP